MPLVAHSTLPTFTKLIQEGQDILPEGRAAHQDIRELHIGLLNMMPDGALEATERQFFRLVGASNLIAQFHMHPFTLDSLPRGEKAQKHIDEHYDNFEQLKQDGLDALIITGATPIAENLEDESFWDGLTEVVAWAQDNVTSTLCSCLASHAIVQHLWNIRRQPLSFKRWGVYSHSVTSPKHPLVANINTRFDVPHSRFNEITRKQLEDAGLHVLVESDVASVHLAVSPDQFRMIFFQGHPEYDRISLLKEYKREVLVWHAGQRDTYPPFPEHYLNRKAKAILNEYQTNIRHTQLEGLPAPEFPEGLLAPILDSTWRDTAQSIISNWIGKVYQITNNDRKCPFMENIDLDNPLQLDKHS